MIKCLCCIRVVHNTKDQRKSLSNNPYGKNKTYGQRYLIKLWEHPQGFLDLARNQDNVPEWSDMSIDGLLFQPIKCFGLRKYKSKYMFMDTLVHRNGM